MQRLIISFILLTISSYSYAKDVEIKANTKISEVTVYQQNALVHRKGFVNVPAGNSTIIIHDLNQSIRPQDVRVQAKGNFTILSISHRFKTDTISGRGGQAKRDLIQKEIQALQIKINRENGFLDIYNKEEQMLLANQNFTHKEEGVDIDRLAKASDFMRSRFFDIKNKRLAIQDLVADLQLKINELSLKQSKIEALKTKTTLEMIVRINSKAQVKGTFMIDYRVYNAGWAPSYDATVDKVSEPLILDYKAKVYQNTGEDWKNVSLIIATGNPNVNKKKPNLLPWYINGSTPIRPRGDSRKTQDYNAFLRSQPFNPNVRLVSGQMLDQNGEPLPFANVMVSGTNSGISTDVNGYYSLEIPANGKQLQYSYIGFNTESLTISNSVMNVILVEQQLELNVINALSKDAKRESKSYFEIEDEKGLFDLGNSKFANVSVSYSFTNTKFKIDASYTIPSDGKEYAVQIQQHEMDAEYIYQCSPKLDPTAYLTAQITDWEEYNLLNGTMNIYFENAFIGQSQLDLSNAEDTLSLSLGEDKNISVTRKRVKSENKKQVLGNNKKVIREFELVIRNNKRESIQILIEDQLPISTTEEIEIESEALSGGKKDELTGKILWDIELGSGKKKTLNFKYNVKYPKQMFLQI